MKILSCLLVLLLGASSFAATPPTFLFKWDSTIAAPGRQGIVHLAPGSVITLEAGTTNQVFGILGEPIPESEQEHQAVSLELHFRFLHGTSPVEEDILLTDQHGVFTPVKHKVKYWFEFKPASQELSSSGTVEVPVGADSFEVTRVAVDRFNAKVKKGTPLRFVLIGDGKALVLASGSSRGEDKLSPEPTVLGGRVRAGKPLSFVFDEYRAMNAWVRTAPKYQSHGIIATYAGSDRRTVTCLNKDPNKIYYEAWADGPLFEITTRVRFDQEAWQDLPKKKLFPDWGSGKMQELFPFPFDTIPGLFRVADPYHPMNTASIYPQTAAHLAPLHAEDVLVPAHAKTVSFQTLIHGYLVAHYGKNFEGAPYVGEDCIKLYADRQRVELDDLWDTPDFTEDTAWTFPVN